MSLVGYTPSTWTEVLVSASIVVPVVVASLLAWVVLRGKASDPDEQRWARLAEQRREAEREVKRR